MKIDCIVCSSDLMEQWVEVLIEGDPDQRLFLQEEMECFDSFPGFCQFEISILQQCMSGGDIDYSRSIAELHAAIDPEDGPWIMAVHTPVVAALSVARVNGDLVTAWVDAASKFAPERREQHEATLTLAAAEALVNLSHTAVDKEMDLFVCYYEG
jgi:hypothetical protein